MSVLGVCVGVGAPIVLMILAAIPNYEDRKKVKFYMSLEASAQEAALLVPLDTDKEQP